MKIDEQELNPSVTMEYFDTELQKLQISVSKLWAEITKLNDSISAMASMASSVARQGEVLSNAIRDEKELRDGIVRIIESHTDTLSQLVERQVKADTEAREKASKKKPFWSRSH